MVNKNFLVIVPLLIVFALSITNDAMALTEIRQSDIPYSCLTSGETYILTEDVSSSSGAISISASNVILDLNNHEVVFDVDGSGGDTGISVTGANALITNGSITQHASVSYESGSPSRAISSAGEGAKGIEISYISINIHGYDTHGIYLRGNRTLAPDGETAYVHHNTISHTGTHLSTRDGFTSEPIKINQIYGKFDISNNVITSSPQAGIVIICRTERDSYDHQDNEGAHDGSVISHNTIDIDNAYYANNGGIHLYGGHAIDIHHNNLTGDGMEGIQIDHGNDMINGALRIRDNNIDINCKRWPRGHSSGPGALQGIRVRYNPGKIEIMNNNIKVLANTTPYENQNNAWGIFISCNRNGNENCEDVKIWGNVVQAITDGFPTEGVGEAKAITIGGVDSNSGLEIYNNEFISNHRVLEYYTGYNENATSNHFHDNILGLESPTYDPQTVTLDWFPSSPNNVSVRNISFIGDANIDDVYLLGSDRSFTFEKTFVIRIIDIDGDPIEGADVVGRYSDGTTAFTVATAANGEASGIFRVATYSSTGNEYFSSFIVTAEYNGEQASISLLSDQDKISEIQIDNIDVPPAVFLHAPQNVRIINQ